MTDNAAGRAPFQDGRTASHKPPDRTPRPPGAHAAPQRPPRARRTKAQIVQLWRQMYGVLEQDHPQSARHVYYRMTDPRLPEPVPKTNEGYVVVQRQLVAMGRSGGAPPSRMGGSATPPAAATASRPSMVLGT